MVVDENGEPVIGASVVELSNPKNGVATDFDGIFSLNCADGATLKISFVGYEMRFVSQPKGALFESRKAAL